MSSTLIFTNIQHGFRKKNGLSCNEYIILDMVYHLHTKPDSKIKDWCYMSRDTMSKEVGISKRGLINIISKLCDDGFLLKNEVTKHLQTTKKWNSVYFTNGAESSPTVKKVHVPSAKIAPDSGEESALEGGEESAPNNNIIYNNIKDNNTYKQKDVDEKSTEILDLEVEEIFEEEKKEPEAFSQKEKKEKAAHTGGAGRRKVSRIATETPKEYPDFMKVYFNFCHQVNGGPPKVDGGDGKALKEIIDYCKTVAKEGNTGIQVFQSILTEEHWKKLDAFTQKKISLKDINYNFNSIVTQIRNNISKPKNNYSAGIDKAVQQIIKEKLNGTFNDDPFADIFPSKN